MTGRPLVDVANVSRTFGRGPSAVVAVHGVTCVLDRGDLIALTGPSGSGKSTLLHLIAGLDLPTTGTVTWPGIGTRAELRPGPVAVVFQAPSLLPPLDVIENVALPLVLQGLGRRFAREAADDALIRLGLGELRHKLPEELSGGQAQRVAAARVLAGRPQLILADEPTGQLDHVNGTLVIDALLDAARHLGAAMIVNTHDRTIADRFPVQWSMTSGRLVHCAVASC
ncbi:MAG: transporter related protein [Ilumatobacteraceae bacterium]|nr:transporter related protein [Ilumatobacteraceae bacterium]